MLFFFLQRFHIPNVVGNVRSCAAIILDCFDRYFDLSHSREAMLRFAHTQLDSSRKSVAKKAARFLQKHEL